MKLAKTSTLQKPQLSPEGYMSLFDTTKEWMVAKTEQSKVREFPNTVEDLKACLDNFENTVIKELPGKQQDMANLAELSEKLKGQKKTTIPPEYDYVTLEEVRISLVQLCVFFYIVRKFSTLAVQELEK